jgi:hypothetical protein
MYGLHKKGASSLDDIEIGRGMILHNPLQYRSLARPLVIIQPHVGNVGRVF